MMSWQQVHSLLFTFRKRLSIRELSLLFVTFSHDIPFTLLPIDSKGQSFE